ncbi:MAG TPA: choice-of-anchor D domain-containing protein, partial [Kofleriaceae bacterium]|nr:choice-of-anchor D domain-containing protein [Kofleriaceae bacterium]
DTDIPFTVASIGSGPFQVTGISATPAELTVDMISSALPATLAGTATLGFRLRIRPTAVGLLSGQVDIATDLPDSPLVVKVTAEGIAGGLAVSPPSIDFGPVVVGADSAARGLGLANCSAGSVTITAVELTGSDAAGFRIETGPQPPPDELLESNQARQWSLVFQPARVGSHVAALTIAMSEGEIVVPLTGSATGGNPDAGSGAGGDNTYYACAVTGRRPWLTLGLVGLALLFASRRRRRPGR